MALSLLKEELRAARRKHMRDLLACWDSSFDEIKGTTQSILDLLQEIQDDVEGIYNPDDRPAVQAALASRRADLDAWEASVPGDSS